MSFENNHGQTDSRVKFLARGKGYALFLTPTEAVLTLRGPEKAARGTILRMRLVGSNPAPAVTGLEELPGRSNYFIGDDPRQWRTDVPNYGKVRYAAVYPGVDLVYYGNQQQLEYDFIVAPGADPSFIALDFTGAERLDIDAQGNLALETLAGDVRWRKPVIYQDIDGVRQIVDGRYVRQGERVGFEVGAYDSRHALVIDPILDYSTYLGGSSVEFGNAIAVDAAGHVYVTGVTQSTNFPVSFGAFQISLGTIFGSVFGGDVFVAKFDTGPETSSPATRVYATYLGGGDGETGRGIAVDALGNAYVTGLTFSRNFPVTLNAYQAALNPNQEFFDRTPSDGFVVKLNAAGNGLLYSTYLGSGGDDSGVGIAVDSSNPAANAYVTGFTFSTSFPTLNAFSGSGGSFLAKLNTGGSGASSLLYSTYLGSAVASTAIDLDSSGNAYLTGRIVCQPSGGVILPGICPNFDLTGGSQALVMKIGTDASGSPFVAYRGGLGESGESSGVAIAVDSSVPPNAYVTGSTSSLSFPGASSSLIQAGKSGGDDAFVAKVNGTGTGIGITVIYSTYLGGSGSDQGTGIAVDPLGNAYVTGETRSNDFPLANAFQSSLNGFSDAFVTKINALGTALVYSTYLGGNSSDSGAGISVDSSGNAYITGTTSSVTFPTARAFQPNNGAPVGGSDAFLAKIVDDTPLPAAPGISLSPNSLNFAATVGGPNPANQTVTISNSGGGTLNWTTNVPVGSGWLGVSPGAGTNGGTITISINIAGLAANTYGGMIEVSDPAATNSPQPIFVQLTLAAAASAASPPSISKNFGANAIVLGASTSLTFTLGNSNSTPLTGVSFTDPLPTGIIVATPSGLSGSCGGGTVTATSGQVGLVNGVIGAGSSCSFSVSVHAFAAGIFTNVTGLVTSNEGGNGGSATAILTVTNPVVTPTHLIDDVIRELERLITDHRRTPLADKLEDVVAKLQGALHKLNQNPPDRQGAIGELEGAVGDLEAARKDGLLTDSAARDLLNQVADVAQMLARQAIADARTRGVNQTVIDEAERAVAAGDGMRAVGRFKDAVARYKDAVQIADGA